MKGHSKYKNVDKKKKRVEGPKTPGVVTFTLYLTDDRGVETAQEESVLFENVLDRASAILKVRSPTILVADEPSIVENWIDTHFPKQTPLENTTSTVVAIPETESSNNAKIRFQRSVVGLDMETAASFHRGVSYSHAPSLIQLALKDDIMLIRLRKSETAKQEYLNVEDCNLLKQLLECQEVVKVGFDLLGDQQELHRHFNIQLAGYCDLKTRANNSLRSLCSEHLNFTYRKNDMQLLRVSNWELIDLDNAHINYAALDAWIPLILYYKIVETAKDNKVPNQPSIVKTPIVAVRESRQDEVNGWINLDSADDLENNSKSTSVKFHSNWDSVDQNIPIYSDSKIKEFEPFVIEDENISKSRKQDLSFFRGFEKERHTPSTVENKRRVKSDIIKTNKELRLHLREARDRKHRKGRDRRDKYSDNKDRHDKYSDDKDNRRDKYSDDKDRRDKYSDDKDRRDKYSDDKDRRDKYSDDKYNRRDKCSDDHRGRSRSRRRYDSPRQESDSDDPDNQSNNLRAFLRNLKNAYGSHIFRMVCSIVKSKYVSHKVYRRSESGEELSPVSSDSSL